MLANLHYELTVLKQCTISSQDNERADTHALDRQEFVLGNNKYYPARNTSQLIIRGEAGIK